MRIEIWLAALALALAACSDTSEPSERRGSQDVAANTEADDTRGATPALGDDADDTGRNTRDGGDLTETPLDQSSSERDLEITRRIRQRMTDADDLSTDAENVKVITKNGVVTLRGPVESNREKEAIAAIARETAGVTQVDDQLEVAAR